MTWIAPGSTIRRRSRPVNEVRSAWRRKETSRALAGVEPHALEAGELEQRPRHLGDGVPQVQLHGLGPPRSPALATVQETSTSPSVGTSSRLTVRPS